MIIIKESETRPAGYRAELRGEAFMLWAVCEAWSLSLPQFLDMVSEELIVIWESEFTAVDCRKILVDYNLLSLTGEIKE